ncbi:hypothetical protein [Haladaptatus sp. NG-SE-30]
MEVNDPLDSPTDATPDTPSPGHRYGTDEERSIPHGWLFVRLGAVICSVSTFSVPASAHGEAEAGHIPVGFAVVIGLPVVAGLLGGIIAIRHRRMTHQIEARKRTSYALSFLLVFLGGTLVFAAIRMSLLVGIIGGTIGVASAVWVTGPGTTTRLEHPGHAHLTLGTICIHRLLEGIVLGALYSTGAVVGLVGATTLAAHTALETAAVGGLYASHRVQALGTIVFVQLAYVVGAVSGLVMTGVIPVSVRITVLALAGGVLLVTGVTETKRSLATWIAPESSVP